MKAMRSLLLLLLSIIPAVQCSSIMVNLFIRNETADTLVIELPAIRLQEKIFSKQTIFLTDICYDDTLYAINIKNLESGDLYETSFATPKNLHTVLITIENDKNKLLLTVSELNR